MIKTREVITDALEMLIVQAEEAPIEQAEAASAIRTLNDMMNQWEAKGIYLGYTIVSDLADEITVPLGAVLGIKCNLALYLAPKYNVEASALLIKNAAESYDVVVDIVAEMKSTEYPSTLPQGSGNEDLGFADQTFFPAQQDTILTETGGSIALEDNTEES